MVIVVFIKQLSIGGAEKQSLLLTRELQRHYRTLLVVWEGAVCEPSYLDFVRRYDLNVAFLKGSVLIRFWKLWRLLRNEKVTHMFNFLLVNNLFGGLAGRLAGVSHIYGGIRNCEIVRHKLLWQKFLHNKISHRTIFNNYAGARALSEKGVRSDKMEVIHNGIDLDEIHAGKAREQGKIVILTAARFLPQKDYYTALRAVGILKEQGYSFVYMIAGYGAGESDLRRWIREMDLEDCVEIKVSPPDLPKLFARAHIYCSTSLREGLSNSIMEALAAGLPVIATDVGDNQYLVKNGENGFLTDVRNSHQIAGNGPERI